MSLHVNELRLQPLGLTTVTVEQFESRADLIAANMASVHVPLFLDGHWTMCAHTPGSRAPRRIY